MTPDDRATLRVISDFLEEHGEQGLAEEARRIAAAIYADTVRLNALQVDAVYLYVRWTTEQPQFAVDLRGSDSGVTVHPNIRTAIDVAMGRALASDEQREREILHGTGEPGPRGIINA